MRIIKLLLGLIGLFCSSSSFASPEQELALVITTSDDTKIYFDLEKLPVLLSDNDYLKVVVGTNENTFLWENIASLAYIKEENVPDNISVIRGEDSNIIFRENGLYIKTGKLLSIRIYNMKGQIVYSGDANNNKFIDFSRFPKGNYLLKSGNHNLKFYVK